MSLNNPAGRLLNLLEKGKEINQGSVKDVLADLLNVSDKSESEKFSRISYLLVVPFQIRELIETIDSLDPDLLIPSLERVESFFGNLNLQNGWASFRNQFNGIIIHNLKICDSILSKKFLEPTLKDKDREAYLKKLDELYEMISNEDLNETAKSFLLTQIEQLIIALESYFITGSKPIIDNITNTVGSIVLSPKKIHGVDKKGKIWKTFIGTFLGLMALIGWANDIKELPQNYPNLLPAIEEVIDTIKQINDDSKD